MRFALSPDNDAKVSLNSRRGSTTATPTPYCETLIGPGGSLFCLDILYIPVYTYRREVLHPCGSSSNPSIFGGFSCNISQPIFASCTGNSPNILKAMSIYSETNGVFSETIALAELRPKSMACRYLRTPAQRTFFRACLSRQNTPQSNPLATQTLNVAKSCIFSPVEIQGVGKTE